MPLLDSHKFALTEWFFTVEQWAHERGITVDEIRELWEGVTPTTPPDAGST